MPLTMKIAATMLAVAIAAVCFLSFLLCGDLAGSAVYVGRGFYGTMFVFCIIAITKIWRAPHAGK